MMSVQFIEKGGGFRPYEALATPLRFGRLMWKGATSCLAVARRDERKGVNHLTVQVQPLPLILPGRGL